MKYFNETLKPVFLLLALAMLPLVAASQVPKMPLLLMQDLQQPPAYIEVQGLHEVEVVADTADFIFVRLVGYVDELEQLTFPEQQIVVAGTTLTITPDFPYRKLAVHTSAQSITIDTKDDSRVTLSSAIGDTLGVEWLKLEAHGNSDIDVISPIACREAYIHAFDQATLRYGELMADEVDCFAAGHGRVHQRGNYDIETSYLRNLVLDHRYTNMFFHFAYGCAGWATSPLGGIGTRVDDYLNSGRRAGFMSLSVGKNLYSTKHWDFGIGIGMSLYSMAADNVLLGLTTDATTGRSHIGVVPEPNYGSHANSHRVWRSSFANAYCQLPLHVEWHRRLDYKGLRLSAEVAPGICLLGKNATLQKEGYWDAGTPDANTNLTDVMFDTIGSAVNRFACDLRFDIGWSNVSLFVQTSLTPIFRTTRRNVDIYLDRRIYNFATGISLNF